MMNVMCGNRYIALSGLCCGLYPYEGLRPSLRDNAPSGLCVISPEVASYTNDVANPIVPNTHNHISHEAASYTNDTAKPIVPNTHNHKSPERV